MFQKTISREEVNELELRRYEGKPVVVTSPDSAKLVIEEILDTEDFVGFDTETKPTFTKGVINDVALIQIASARKVFLIRVNQTGLTPQLKYFFETSEVAKIGVALLDDIRALQRLRHFEPNNFQEINKLVKDVGIESDGLRKLTAIILGFRISKNQQTSNWENETLTDKQINYAATDAWVCREMYTRLRELGYL
ncbi:MAG: 3'-5' exonuclease [Bacteroidota bacterium]